MRIKVSIALLMVGSLVAFAPWSWAPEHFPEPEYRFDKNPLDGEKVELGRKLFYDPLLSANNTISCASCHSPYNAFAHTDHDLSHGIYDSVGKRNAPALFNLAWQKSFMWDGAINHLDVQALAPISHPGEMGEDIAHVVDKLQDSPYYTQQFMLAWGDSLITGARVLKSLSQFQLSLVSANAKYDKVKRGQVQFNEQEERGYALFQKNCNSCHTEPLFSSYDFASNRLPIDSSLNDFGKGSITGLKTDSLQFKIPSLRNLSFSYPYMHDGRFRKLSEVLKHYASTELQADAEDVEIDLNANDRVDLIAFLLTLNDTSFVFDPKHQFPREILSAAKEY